MNNIIYILKMIRIGVFFALIHKREGFMKSDYNLMTTQSMRKIIWAVDPMQSTNYSKNIVKELKIWPINLAAKFSPSRYSRNLPLTYP